MNDYTEHIEYPYATIANYNPQISAKAIEEATRKLVEAASTYAIPSLNPDFKTYQQTKSTTKKPKDTKDTKDSTKPVEKWIWVEGYKGTNKDMQGHGNYQFELGKRYDMPTDVEIKDCHSGFHLSLNMRDVFNHYKIGGGNRFFKVKALVREKDLNEYGKDTGKRTWFMDVRDKLASQSIEFIRELTIDEIFQDTEWKDWSEEYKKMAIVGSLNNVQNMIKADELVALGFSMPFAMYIIKNSRFDKAKAIASQFDLSMDMKAYLIMR